MSHVTDGQIDTEIMRVYQKYYNNHSNSLEYCGMNAGGVRTGWRTAYVRIFATARVLPRTTVKALYSAYATEDLICNGRRNCLYEKDEEDCPKQHIDKPNLIPNGPYLIILVVICALITTIVTCAIVLNFCPSCRRRQKKYEQMRLEMTLGLLPHQVVRDLGTGYTNVCVQVSAVQVLHKNLTAPTSLSHAAGEQRRPARRRRRHSVPSFVPGKRARVCMLREGPESDQSIATHARYEIEHMTHRAHQQIPDWARRSRERDAANHDDLTTSSSPKQRARRVVYAVPQRSPPPPTVLSPYGHARNTTTAAFGN
ncbi:unnamed protein product [Sphagnum balticum]